jgi:hypothetical protein
MPGRSIRYRCSCGNETETHSSNIRKPNWKGCPKCSNQKRGNTQNFEYARTIFATGGETLPDQPYNNNKGKLFYTCSFCAGTAHVSLSEFRRGRRCELCPKERAKVTNVEKYGVENPFQAEVCKEKGRETNLRKYGQEHHMQNVEISEKSLKTTMAGKRYTFPSGRVEQCQGYEPRCFDILLETHNEDDILITRSAMPIIWYDNPSRKKKSIYYPDAFLPSEKIVIEVKSVYTIGLEKDRLINEAKFRATVTHGFELHLYVFNHKTLLYKKVYRKESITVSPYPPAEIDWSELE